ncbi:MAG TPA: xanthine dehydrogenase family protein subunit M [Tepidiformaceae bacterium]
MEAFEYIAPRTLAEAYQHLGNGKRTAMLAGGTDIIVQLREGRRSCDQVLDLKHIPELMALAFTSDGTLEIGAATPLADIYEDPEVARRLPGLVDAASLIGGIQIQGRATLGGNLCNASPAADSAPALIALAARLVIGSSAGTRELPVEEFFLGPGQNALQPGEILLQVKIPPQPPGSGACFLRFIPRNEMDIAVANAGVSIQLSDDRSRIERARVAVGAVAPTPLLVPAAANALVGQAPTAETLERAAQAAAEAATPITDMRGSAAQRRHLTRVMTLRALNGALQRATENR